MIKVLILKSLISVHIKYFREGQVGTHGVVLSDAIN